MNGDVTDSEGATTALKTVLLRAPDECRCVGQHTDTRHVSEKEPQGNRVSPPQEGGSVAVLHATKFVLNAPEENCRPLQTNVRCLMVTRAFFL